MARFVIIMAQGRSGSTLLLRMLNATPGVHLAGENGKALDHLRAFVESYRGATAHHHTEFYRLAWQLPCPVEEITARTSAYIQQLYNPDGRLSVAGFKEIRYGRAYDELCRDIEFLREMLPELRIIFNTRATDDAVNSEFWTENPTLSRQILDETRRNFERYHAEHPAETYLMPYEELREGSAVLEGMFTFLGLRMGRQAIRELRHRLR